MQVLVEHMKQFRCLSTPGMVTNKMIEPVSLTGHQIDELDAINVSKGPDPLRCEVTVGQKQLVSQLIHVKTTIIC